MSALPAAVENLVIGGGPAGAMAAMRLAEAGRSVTLIEKEHGPHDKVCGEFLSREAVAYLHQAGVSPAHLGAAAIRMVRLASGRRVVETALPFRALSLSRRVLDAALLERAASQGCDVKRGACVARLTRDDDTWFVHLGNGEKLRARTVFLACGKHDLHGWNRAGGVQGDLIGFKLHWRLMRSQTDALREAMELFLFSGGYGGLSLIEEDRANLCLVVRRAVLRVVGGWNGLLAAIAAENRHLRQRLQGAETTWARPLAISPIPYGYLAERAGGLWRVGDQAAVIPSFTGDGMSIALHSAALAAQMYLSGKGTEEYSRTLRTQLGRPMRLATWLSQAMVTAGGRRAAPPLLSLLPRAMQWIAAATRIPDQALLIRMAHHGTSLTSAE